MGIKRRTGGGVAKVKDEDGVREEIASFSWSRFFFESKGRTKGEGLFDKETGESVKSDSNGGLAIVVSG